MSKEIELKACPHCGKTDLRIGYNAICERHYVVCASCLMRGPEKCADRERAVKAWNGLPRALVWSSEPPSEPGLWWRELLGHKSVELIQDPKNRGVQDSYSKWAGPIPEPKEAKQ